MSGEVKIRMYNVGFGDSFLITLPDNRLILIDAGFHSQGKGDYSGDELASQIIENVTDIAGEAHIDVVIATHRHADHLFAFNSAAWDEVSVGEVWLPWVEDRQNEKAMRLWKKQQLFATNLAMALSSFQLNNDDRESVEFMLRNAGVEAPGFAAAGGWSNARALDRLHEGFGYRRRTKPRFLPATRTFPETFTTPELPDVLIHVLGPPRDPDLIEELDPEADGETYRALAMRAAAASGVGDMSSLTAFGAEWQVGEDEPIGDAGLSPSEIKRLEGLATSADAVMAATHVDDMINSTSLVLVIEVGKARLLFPGDAEWGTWKRILANDDARALLHNANFLKVGHHGSHNATSKTLVENILPGRIPAMISTQAGAGKYRNNIPLPDLMDALDAHDIRFVRSDSLPGRLPKGFRKGDQGKWVELSIPC